MSEARNLLLRCLSDNARAALWPHFDEVKLSPGSVLSEAGEKVSTVYFPNSGAVSLIVEMSCGDTVETAMIGRDGAVNALASVDHNTSLSKAVVLLPGSALKINVDQLRDCAVQYHDLRELIVKHAQVLIGEIQQAAACNIMDVVEARLARWLLRARDLAESNELPLTQEAIAQMLGVELFLDGRRIEKLQQPLPCPTSWQTLQW